jgi:putative Holliday junction resolvase
MIPARVVAIDYGQRRVGIAVADPLRLFAQSHGTYDPERALEVLQKIYNQEGIETALIGWPLTLDGKEGEATERVAAYIDRLKLVLPGVEIVKWDERFTSERAKEIIRESGARKKARRDKARVDAAAASIMLQEYLDEHSGR